MTTYYCGIGGNDANAGTSWALRRLTLNASEDLLTAGDTLYIGPGTYRELWTIDHSGSGGSPITAIGDYTGAQTDGVGGLVRITGAANETTTGTRANCISASSKNYRTFRGFLMDGSSSSNIACTSGTNWIIDQCVLGSDQQVAGSITFDGAGQSTNAVSNCVFVGFTNWNIQFTHSSVVDNAAHTVKSCAFIGSAAMGVRSDRVGGITVANCLFYRHSGHGARVNTALTAGQTMTVNNCIVAHCGTGLSSATLGDLVENYNALHNNSTARTNVTAGANSVAYPPGFDMRPYFEALNVGTLVLPLVSLASYSGLVEYSAGTGAPSTDIRGHAVSGSLREYGAEEYVSTYTVEGGGGGIVVSPLGQQIIQALLGGSQ